jgi:hypothetical protein
MKRMRRVYPLLLAALLALLLSGCGAEPRTDGSSGGAVSTPGTASVSSPVNEPSDTVGAEPHTPVVSTEPVSSGASPSDSDPKSKLQQAAKDVMDILRDRDLQRLSDTIDPQKGLRFAPYPHIDEKSERLFQAGGLPTFKDTNKLNWGAYDGSGEPIELTFREYFEKFVYDQDYASAPSVKVNQLLGVGNVKFNAKEVYPEASFVEYHFPGFDKKNDGMDWESLVLVFRPAGEEWKLCAIVHGQWTI